MCLCACMRATVVALGSSLIQFLLGMCRWSFIYSHYMKNFIIVYFLANYRPQLSHFCYYGSNSLTANLPNFKSLLGRIFHPLYPEIMQPHCSNSTINAAPF